MRRLTSSFLELIFLGRSGFNISGIMLLESLILLVSLFISAPIEYPLPASKSVATGLFISASVFFVVILYLFLSFLGYQTYSVRLHDPVHVALSTAIYLVIGVIGVFIGYSLFIYPYVGSWPTEIVQYSLGWVIATVYADILVLSVLANDILFRHEVSKPEHVENFLNAAESIRNDSSDGLTTEPDDLLAAGNQLVSELQSSRIQSSEDLKSDLRRWLEIFENRDIRGQKKMLGDIPDSDTEFSVWQDRYARFRRIQGRLNKLSSSAVYKIGLSVRRISVGIND